MGSAPRPGRLYPRERTGTHFTGGCVGLRACLEGRKLSSPPDSIPDRPTRSSVAIPTELPGPHSWNIFLLFTFLIWSTLLLVRNLGKETVELARVRERSALQGKLRNAPLDSVILQTWGDQLITWEYPPVVWTVSRLESTKAIHPSSEPVRPGHRAAKAPLPSSRSSSSLHNQQEELRATGAQAQTMV